MTAKKMTPKQSTSTFRVEADVRDAMDVLKDRDGMPYSEQIRRALREWLVWKGVLKAESKRVSARKLS